MKEGKFLEQFLQQLINGISLGSTYALIALGYTMVYGIIQLINFAHCDVYMIGAYIGFYCLTVLDLGFVPSLLIAMVLCMVLGVVIEKVAYKPLRNSPRITLLITAIGVSLLLEYGMMALVGATVKSYPEPEGLLAIQYGKPELGIDINIDAADHHHRCVRAADDTAAVHRKIYQNGKSDACGFTGRGCGAFDGHQCGRDDFIYIYARLGFCGRGRRHGRHAL